MLATDEDALLCDFAETYGVYDLEALPVEKLAVLSFGLRDDSRIKLKMAGAKMSIERSLLAGCFDILNWIRWSMTEDGRNGINHPKRACDILSGKHTDNEQDTKAVLFDTPEDFRAARGKILEKLSYGY